MSSLVLSIYVAERCRSDGQYHSYLVLVDSSDPELLSPIEELHFSFTEDDKLKSVVKRNPCGELDRADIFCRLRTDEEYALVIWNAFLKTAKKIDSCKIDFVNNGNPDDQHCRAGVQTSCTITGVPRLVGGGKYSPVTPMDLIRYLDDFNLDLDFDCPLKELREEHEALVASM